MGIDIQQEHRDFLAWARSMGYDVSRPETLGPEEIGFVDSHTAAAWNGWQGRAPGRVWQ